MNVYTLPIERMHFFKVRREAWTDDLVPMKTSELIVEICKEKQWHIKFQ